MKKSDKIKIIKNKLKAIKYCLKSNQLTNRPKDISNGHILTLVCDVEELLNL